ncbi:MAG: DUF3181 family protein [Cyanobacteria bacterium REEB459]|nr:DUF3181 family protein [Cyanobacteria bacterium REEB459]
MAKAGTTKAIEELAAAIGEQAYLQVADWHLYLADAKLHLPLAEALYPLLLEDRFTDTALAELLANTSVSLGGGKKMLPLAELMPARSLAHLVEAIAAYQRQL